MAREIRAPEEIADACDGEQLVDYARDLSGIVARYTHHTQAHVMECVLAAAAVSVAAWLAGYAEGMADGTRLLAEWCRRHMGEGDGE